jgi:hypothetical protein
MRHLMISASVRLSSTPDDATKTLYRVALRSFSCVGVRVGQPGDMAATASVSRGVADHYISFELALFDAAVRTVISVLDDVSLLPGTRKELSQLILREGRISLIS